MYRIFCESYENFLKTFDEDNYRLNISRPLELISNMELLKREKKLESEIYKKLCDLISYMQENIKRFPSFKAFLWTINSRNIKGKKYNISSNEELEEQAKLVNSFLKLSYWF